MVHFYLSTEQRTTQQGQVYFLHTQTGVSTWHDPRVPRYVIGIAQVVDQSVFPFFHFDFEYIMNLSIFSPQLLRIWVFSQYVYLHSLLGLMSLSLEECKGV